MSDDDRLRKLEARLLRADTEAEKRRVEDAIAEEKGFALTGDAHGREGGDETS